MQTQHRSFKRSLSHFALTAVALGLLYSGVASAHLTGVFSYFVKDMESPTYSSRLLQQQVEEIDARIEAVEPEVQAAQIAYEAAAEPIAKRLRFYDAYAASALGGLWAGAEDLVDILATSRMMENLLQEDLQELAPLADTFRRLQLKEASLTRYRDLLEAIAKTSEARTARLATTPPDMDETYGQQLVLYRLAEDWEQMRENSFMVYFERVNRKLRNISELVQPGSDSKEWVLAEGPLNKAIGGAQGSAEQVRIFLRADHIYLTGIFTGPSDTYRLLTVGQMERANNTTIQYRIEGLYVDGFPVDPGDPDVQEDIYEASLLRIDAAPLLAEGQRLVFEQDSGYLRLSGRP